MGLMQACCDCTDGCRDRDRCACLRLRAGDEGNNDTDAWPEGVASSGGDGRHARSPEEDEISQRFYGDNGLLLLERRAIFECHEKCVSDVEVAAPKPHCLSVVVCKPIRLTLCLPSLLLFRKHLHFAIFSVRRYKFLACIRRMHSRRGR